MNHIFLPICEEWMFAGSCRNKTLEAIIAFLKIYQGNVMNSIKLIKKMPKKQTQILLSII